jgi:molecular chaperone IbpA
MATFDFSPLFRSTVGFDRLGRLLENTLEDSGANGYPPYNIEKRGEDEYRIVLAVAGFAEDDLDVTVKEGTLIVSGRIEDKDDDVRYLHRGIAGRAFERRFELADHIEVKDGRLENGLLVIELKREIPEALKPRKIEIASANSGRKTIEQQKAA